MVIGRVRREELIVPIEIPERKGRAVLRVERQGSMERREIVSLPGKELGKKEVGLRVGTYKACEGREEKKDLWVE